MDPTVAVVQIAMHHVPAAQQFLDLGTLSLQDCLLSIGIGLIPVTVLELSKLVRRIFAGESKP
ncbi:MAG: hypothetical protein IT462_00575 [Planctomycetes bacterium]|nr:hypothetical protein [Planctomycetota bacterium]